MVEVEVMLRFPPIIMLAKSIEPALTVRAPVVVRASSPVILPTYQLPAADTATPVERARLPIGVPSTPILARVMVPLPEVRVTLEVPRRVPSEMLSLDVVMERAPLGVMAPKVMALVSQLPAVEMTPVPCGVIFTVPTALLAAPTVPMVMLPLLPEASVTLKSLPVTLPTSMVEVEVMSR